MRLSKALEEIINEDRPKTLIAVQPSLAAREIARMRRLNGPLGVEPSSNCPSFVKKLNTKKEST